MKIRYITAKLPTLFGGSHIRNYYLMRAMIKDSHTDVEICYLDSGGVESVEAVFEKPLRRFVTERLSMGRYIGYLLVGKIPYIAAMRSRDLEREWSSLGETDIVQFQELESYVATKRLHHRIKGVTVLDQHNIDHVRLASEFASKSVILKWLVSPWLWVYKRQEIQAVRRVDYVLVCSEKEKEYFAQYTDSNKIIVVPNGVKVEYFNTLNSGDGKKRVVFMGSLLYPANSSGIRHYLDHIHPMVIKEVPDVVLTIVGKNPPHWLDRYTKKYAIEVTGFVEDVRDYLSPEYVGICPIYEGSGTRLKVMEYMASGMAVVSSKKGCEGIRLRYGVDLLVANDDKEFGMAVVRLLKDEVLRGRIGKQGGKAVVGYDWVVVTRNLKREYEGMVEEI